MFRRRQTSSEQVLIEMLILSSLETRAIADAAVEMADGMRDSQSCFLESYRATHDMIQTLLEGAALGLDITEGLRGLSDEIGFLIANLEEYVETGVAS